MKKIITMRWRICAKTDAFSSPITHFNIVLTLQNANLDKIILLFIVKTVRSSPWFRACFFGVFSWMLQLWHTFFFSPRIGLAIASALVVVGNVQQSKTNGIDSGTSPLPAKEDVRWTGGGLKASQHPSEARI